MSGSWRPHEDDPVITSPALAELVDLARNQRVPTLRTTAAMLSARVETHGRGRRRLWLTVAAVGAVAAALLVSIGPRMLEAEPDSTPASAVYDDATPQVEGDAAISEPSEASTVPTPPVVAPTVEVVPTSPTEVPATLDVPLQQPKPTLDGPPSAAELARAAERSMAAGRRDETIRLLTQLVRRYPKSSPARAALFDLGRLLRASGRNDEARCAYRLLRHRWPSDAMRGEIDRVLTSLGDGPECRGLQPLQ